MAVTKTVLKKAHQEAVVKVAGTAAAATISLASDLLHTNQALTSGGTPTGNIVGACWTGAATSTITIVRGGVTILSIPADQPDNFNFEGLGFVDTVGKLGLIDFAKWSIKQNKGKCIQYGGFTCTICSNNQIGIMFFKINFCDLVAST